MNRKQLEEALREVGKIARETEFIVFGSQAILGLVDRPPRVCLVSREVDLYPKNNYRAARLILARLGRRSRFAVERGYFVDCVDPALATFPDGWTERLVAFSNERTGGVTGWCMELHDIAVSKLAAGRPKDLQYLRALLREKLLKKGTLVERIEETATTRADRETMRARLKKLVKEPVVSRRRSSSTKKSRQRRRQLPHA